MLGIWNPALTKNPAGNYSALFKLVKPLFGPLAQSAERGADNAKVVSSILIRTISSFSLLHTLFFVFLLFAEKK